MKVKLMFHIAWLLAFGHADAAMAEKASDRLWPNVIVYAPIKVPDGIWVKPTKTIMTLSQRETGLSKLSQNFVSPLSGQTVLSTEALHLFKHKFPVFCTQLDIIKDKKGSRKDFLRYCFLDENSDGTLDKYFIPKNRSVTSLFHYVVLPSVKKMEDIQKFHIELVPVDDFIMKEELRLIFLGYGLLGSGMQFLICDDDYVDPKGALYSMNNCIMPWVRVDEKSIPIEIRILDARFLIKEKRDSEIKVVQIDPIKGYDLHSNMR